MIEGKNEAADALSRLGSRREPVPPNVFLDELWKPSVSRERQSRERTILQCMSYFRIAASECNLVLKLKKVVKSSIHIFSFATNVAPRGAKISI